MNNRKTIIFAQILIIVLSAIAVLGLIHSNGIYGIFAACGLWTIIMATKVNGGYTLSLYATSYLRSMIQSSQNMTARTTSWNAIVSKCSGSSKWKNAGGLRDQYMCHLSYALNKTPYNIETWRPDVSYAATVAARCNP